MNPTWYGLTRDLHIREDGPVTLDEALARARQCVARVRPHYHTGEEALAETTFGLSYAPDHFLEFCVHSAQHISMRYGVPGRPWYRRLFRRHGADERELRSVADVSRAITDFCTIPAPGVEAALRSAGAWPQPPNPALAAGGQDTEGRD